MIKTGHKNKTGTAMNLYAGNTRHSTKRRALILSFLDTDTKKKNGLRDAPKPTKQKTSQRLRKSGC